MTAQRPTLARLLRFAAPLYRQIALSVLLGTAAIGSSVGLMGASAFIIASAALQPPLAELQVAIVGVRFFGIARGVFRYLERLVSHNVTFGLLARLRVWFYERVEPLAPARLETQRSGDLLARIVADVEELEEFYVRVIAPPLVALLVAAGTALFFARFHARLALTLLVFLTLAGLGLTALIRALSREPGRALVAARAELNTQAVDAVQGLPDLVACGQAGEYGARLGALTTALNRAQLALARVEGLHAALGSLLAWLAVIALLWQGIPLVRAEQIDGVQLTVVVLAALASFEAVLPLPLAAQHLESSLEAGRRLFEIADAGPPVTAPASPLPAPAHAGLEVRDLRFSYAPGGPRALDGVSFSLPPGRRVAVVGPSGAGKSTLAALLLRFREFEAGEITLGGVDVRRLDPAVVRRAFGVVTQPVHLFNATLRDNLLMARREASEAEMVEAARRAQVHDFIMSLPQGYETWAGEQGARLSGGERQRIAIARALLRGAPVLLLDEPTANLDAVTERAVLDAIFDVLTEDQSLLLITHRLVGLEAMDEILVMDAGRIVERGRHADLIARSGGLYRRLWALQHETLG